MINVMKMDLRRGFFSYKFVLSVLGIAILCMVNSMRFFGMEDLLYAYTYTKGLTISIYLSLVIANLAFGTSLCEDIHSQMIRSVIIRSSTKKYVLSKILIGIFVSCIAYGGGSIIFLFIKSFQIPLVADSSSIVGNIKEISIFASLLPNHPIVFLGMQILLDGLCCSVMSVAALCLSTFIPNEYIVITAPMIVYYVQYYFFDGFFQQIINIENIFDITFTGEKSMFLFFIKAILFLLISYISLGYISYNKIKRRLEHA